MEIIESFGIQPTLLLAQIVNFVIILFLLKKFFFKPISKVLENRRQKIEESLKNADLIEEKLTKTEEKSAKVIEEAQNNARELIDEAKAEAQDISAKAAIDAKKTLDQTLTDAKAQIESEKRDMQKKLEQETLTLIAHVTKKILGRNLSRQEKQQLTLESVKETSKKLK